MSNQTQLNEAVKIIIAEIKAHNGMIKKDTLEKMNERLEKFVEQSGTDMLSADISEGSHESLTSIQQQFDNFRSICESVVGQLDDIAMPTVDIDADIEAIESMNGKVDRRRKLMAERDGVKATVAARQLELDGLEDDESLAGQIDELISQLEVIKRQVDERKSESVKISEQTDK